MVRFVLYCILMGVFALAAGIYQYKYDGQFYRRVIGMDPSPFYSYEFFSSYSWIYSLYMGLFGIFPPLWHGFTYYNISKKEGYKYYWVATAGSMLFALLATIVATIGFLGAIQITDTLTSIGVMILFVGPAVVVFIFEVQFLLLLFLKRMND